MTSIQLNYLTLTNLNDILELTEAAGYKDEAQLAEPKATIEENVESTLEHYLSTCNHNKIELTDYLVKLSQPQFSELLALYYYFSKLTYDTELTSAEKITSLWQTCHKNAEHDIQRIGLEGMIEFFRERTNLASIISNALLNLK